MKDTYLLPDGCVWLGRLIPDLRNLLHNLAVFQLEPAAEHFRELADELLERAKG